MNDKPTSKLVPLPGTLKELLNYRMTEGGKEYLPDINSHIEELHKDLYEQNEHYRRLLTAYYNAAAVEGTMVADDYAAAMTLRDYAANKIDGKSRDPFIEESNLAAIVRALRVVMKRWKISRKLRAQKVGNTVVLDDDDDKEDDGE